MSFNSVQDNRHWTDDEISLLRIVSQVLTNALQRKAQEESLQKYAHIVSSSSDLLALVDSSYRFQAISKSHFKLRLSSKRCLSLYGHRCPYKLKQDLASDGIVMADPTQVHQIIMNLCTNAACAMKDKNVIWGVVLHDIDIEAKHTAERHNLAPGKYVRLTVSDTGAGIPQRIKERIFDPFFCDKTKR